MRLLILVITVIFSIISSSFADENVDKLKEITKQLKTIKSLYDSGILEQEEYEKVASTGEQSIGQYSYRLEGSLSSKVVDLPSLHNLMGDKFYDMCNFTITNLKKWAKDNSQSIDEYVIQIDGRPRLKREIK